MTSICHGQGRLTYFSLILVLLGSATADAAKLIPTNTVRRHGLVRCWFTQARLDPARNTIENVVLHADRLFVLTSTGSIQAYDAETGERMWTTSVGNPDYPSVGPVANDTHVAVVNGATVYVLDRTDGTKIMEARTTDAPAAAPALSKYFVYVPQFSGRIDAIGIENPRPIPWYFTSAGRIFENPVASETSIVWATDAGHLYVADPDAGGIRFRYETALPVVAPATVQAGVIFAASTGGYVYALDEANGQQIWRYACGAPVIYSPVALGETLYVATREPALHCLDAKTGRPKWITPSITQIVGASPKRVYGLDRLGTFLVMDRATGAIQNLTPSIGDYHAVLNEQNDRLYLFTPDGLLQCFHEVGLDKPALHTPKQAVDEEPEEAEPAPDAGVAPEVQAPEPEPSPADPFGGGEDPFGGGDPFGGDAADPFGAPLDSDSGDDADADPFGGGGDAGDDPFSGDNPFN